MRKVAEHYKVEPTMVRCKMSISKMKGVMAVDKLTGEIVEDENLYRPIWKEYDVSRYVKVFKPEELIVLDGNTLKVLMFIAYKMEKQRTDIIFNEKDCELMTGLSKTVIYRSLKELMDKDILHKHFKMYYEVNPNHLYRGKRNNLQYEETAVQDSQAGEGGK